MSRLIACSLALIALLAAAGCSASSGDGVASKAGAALPECCATSAALVASLDPCCRDSFNVPAEDRSGCCVEGLAEDTTDRPACCENTLAVKASMPACCQDKMTAAGEACCDMS